MLECRYTNSSRDLKFPHYFMGPKLGPSLWGKNTDFKVFGGGDAEKARDTVEWKNFEEWKLLYRLAAVVASSGNTASEFVSPLKHTVCALTLKTIHSVHVVYWHDSYNDHRKHYSPRISGQKMIFYTDTLCLLWGKNWIFTLVLP
jgi:hypothetical protein